MRILNGAFVLIALLVLAQILAYLPRVDGPFPSHFGIDGRPDGWTSRGGVIALTVGALVVATALAYGAPAFVTRLPKEMLNLPRRDEWMAPATAPRAHALLTVTYRVLALATLALFLTVQQWVYAGALHGESGVAPARVLTAVATYVAVVLGVVTWMCLRFRRGPA